ncbi:hypothetical protein, partial [Xanthomonas arboricola]|uniref:hypothetical protein n=1 Tax=Xanthomonas arboricola TaxID=56448 RepID=UPI001CBCD62A
MCMVQAKQDVRCSITVRATSFASQVEHWAGFQNATCNLFIRLSQCKPGNTLSKSSRATFWCGVLAGCGTLGG